MEAAQSMPAVAYLRMPERHQRTRRMRRIANVLERNPQNRDETLERLWKERNESRVEEFWENRPEIRALRTELDDMFDQVDDDNTRFLKPVVRWIKSKTPDEVKELVRLTQGSADVKPPEGWGWEKLKYSWGESRPHHLTRYLSQELLVIPEFVQEINTFVKEGEQPWRGEESVQRALNDQAALRELDDRMDNLTRNYEKVYADIVEDRRRRRERNLEQQEQERAAVRKERERNWQQQIRAARKERALLPKEQRHGEIVKSMMKGIKMF